MQPDAVHSTLQRFLLADGLEPIFDAKRSHGAFMVDARSGTEYLDLFSFFATQPLGFNHPKLNRPEFRALLGELALHRPTLSDIYTPEYARFVETFARFAGKAFTRFFFIEGGALGVENALKVAFDWKVRKNLAKGKGEKGTQVIHFREAFHGRTGYTITMTNTFDPNKYQYFPKFPWPRIVNPKLHFPLTEESLRETAALETKALDEIQAALRAHPDDIAALIIEPIQAEGGDNHFRGEFLRELRKLADQNEFLLIFDEVQTGMGVTGKMWCFEHFGVTPDVISFGKKAQIAGCAVGPRVDEVKENVFHVPSRLNSTWGGNLVDMIRCTRYLEILEEDHLFENTTDVGADFLERLTDWSRRTPRITNVRGRGLMIAFDLPDNTQRDEFRRRVFENRAILLACGPRSIRLRPHLDFRKEDVDRGMEILEKSERQMN